MHLQLGQPGPSTWQSRSLSLSLPEKVFKPRSPARRGPIRTAVFLEQSVVNSSGGFNGSCAATQQDGTAIETPSGSCASYYPDITVYCCSGVSGTMETLPYSVNTRTADNVSLVQEPICNTSRYSDSLSCFRMTAEAHCRSAASGLYGVCNPNGADSSTVAKSAARSRWQESAWDMGWKGKVALVMGTMAVWSICDVL
ncbi:hypothetical protein BCV69DRAFT_282968 [Microstroma glucosiphilum]|uniref:Uncharacterized protein n=1 Tax=Pseudomicrostroma glucosiphilum TaxID=1684307 RepID=A0A316U675_9BASI|nr:hypothetical protein BCV69DRAFT_282968 [Pseudomicrostroma glucosiphilum]PWN20746.1 hypothetical protein BCV69DRAFT_282968 [Pseudomicrostroma glucosiphilum]